MTRAVIDTHLAMARGCVGDSPDDRSLPFDSQIHTFSSEDAFMAVFLLLPVYRQGVFVFDLVFAISRNFKGHAALGIPLSIPRRENAGGKNNSGEMLG